LSHSCQTASDFYTRIDRAAAPIFALPDFPTMALHASQNLNAKA